MALLLALQGYKLGQGLAWGQCWGAGTVTSQHWLVPGDSGALRWSVLAVGMRAGSLFLRALVQGPWGHPGAFIPLAPSAGMTRRRRAQGWGTEWVLLTQQ